MLQERREVRSRTERRDADVRIFRRLGPFGFGQRLDRLGTSHLEHRCAGARIVHVARHLADELLQRVRPAGVHPPFAVAVGVDVDHALAVQLVAMRLGPLGGAEQAPFLAVPERQHDRALGPPAGLQQLAQAAAHFHQRHRAADRIVGAVDPRVVMVAEHHPLVGPRGAGDAHDHVVERPRLPVEREFQPHLRRTRAQAIGHRQRPAPGFGRHGSFHGLEERQRVTPGNRHDRDLQDRLRLSRRQLAAAGYGAPARRERVAGVHGHVHHAAALHAELGAVGPIGIHLALEEPVVLGIGVDQTADGAVLEGHLGLDAAPTAAVARQHDLALHAHAELLELLVVGGHAVVHVDHLTGDVAVGRVGVEGRRLIVVGGIRIARHRRLLDHERAAGRPDHLEPALGGPGHVGFELFDRGVQPERLELGQRVVGHHLRPRAPGHVWLGRHGLHVLAQPRRLGHGAETFFEGALRLERIAREAAQGGRLAGHGELTEAGGHEGEQREAKGTRHPPRVSGRRQWCK